MNLGTLADPAISLFTGDATICTNCTAAMTVISKYDKVNHIWRCEYCQHENKVELEDEEIPKSESIDYVIPTIGEGAGSRKSENSDIIVFCIDISNSMCITSEVSGAFKFKNFEKNNNEFSQFLETNQFGGLADQYLPRENRSVSYVSRLQCVQAAISSQVETLASEHPNKRVAIVTFADDVKVYLPDGTSHTISGDRLNNYNFLTGVASMHNMQISSSVKDSKKNLLEIIRKLDISGQTALGPGLLVSIGLASLTAGSSVILCTDGIANVGLGLLDGLEDTSASLFYQQAAETAISKGVNVSVLSIKGSNTSLEHIAKVASLTSGYNDIVDPLNLNSNFNFILQNQMVATEVSIKYYLHKSLRFLNENNVSGLTAIREVGNVTQESVITFEYNVGDLVEAKKLKEIPFQIQIRYKRLDGVKCLRVLSRVEKITNDRNVAEQDMNVNVIAISAQQRAANLASEGSYTTARMVQKSAMRMAKRGASNFNEEQNEQLNAWNSKAVKLNSALKVETIQERKEGHAYNSDSDDEEKKSIRQMTRKKNRTTNDSTANVIHQAANPRLTDFTSNNANEKKSKKQ